MGLPPQTPPEGRLSLRLPSSLRGGLKKGESRWIAMQSIEGENDGALPHTPSRDHCSLHPFSASRRFEEGGERWIAMQSIEGEKTMGLCPIPQQETYSLPPFFASRWFEI